MGLFPLLAGFDRAQFRLRFRNGFKDFDRLAGEETVRELKPFFGNELAKFGGAVHGSHWHARGRRRK